MDTRIFTLIMNKIFIEFQNYEGSSYGLNVDLLIILYCYISQEKRTSWQEQPFRTHLPYVNECEQYQCVPHGNNREGVNVRCTNYYQNITNNFEFHFY